MEYELKNIGDAIANFNLTNKETDIKVLQYEKLCTDLGLLRDIANITLQDMAAGLKVTEQTIRNFEKGDCTNFKIVLYYYFKLIKVFGFVTMSIITEELDEYLSLEFGDIYADYKKLSNN